MKKNLLLASLCSIFSVAAFAIGPVVGTSSTCVGGYAHISDVTIGGTWSSSNNSIATVAADPTLGHATVHGVMAGTCTISYTCACGGTGTEIATMSFTVTPAPYIFGSDTVCDGSVVTYTGTPAGGQWISTPSYIGKVDDIFAFTSTTHVKFFSTGVVDLKYMIGGCTADKYINSNPSPFCITGPVVVNCGCSCPKTFTCSTPGGTWDCSNHSIATISSGGVLTCHAEGCVDVIYIWGGCEIRKTITITTHDRHIGSKVSGIVDNNTGGSMNPEDRIEVQLIDIATGNVAMSYMTNSSGYYEFTDILDGAYKVNPTQVGYTTTNANVVISPSNETAVVDFVKNTASGEIAPMTNSVRSFTSNKEINIYPNPSNGTINIKWQNQVAGDANVVVTDVAGREVYHTVMSINATNGQASLDLNTLENGLYLLSVKSENISYNGRIQIVK